MQVLTPSSKGLPPLTIILLQRRKVVLRRGGSGTGQEPCMSAYENKGFQRAPSTIKRQKSGSPWSEGEHRRSGHCGAAEVLPEVSVRGCTGVWSSVAPSTPAPQCGLAGLKATFPHCSWRSARPRQRLSQPSLECLRVWSEGNQSGSVTCCGSRSQCLFIS